MPNDVSRMIASSATYIIGLTGDNTAKNDVASRSNFVLTIGSFL